MSKMPLEKFIKDLSVADIKEMIYTLAKQIFPVLESQEKEDFIKKLMGKFTDDRVSSMANLWLAVCMDEGVDPKNMCKSLVQELTRDAEIEDMAVPEIRALFRDWMEELDQQIGRIVATRQDVTPEQLGKELHIG